MNKIIERKFNTLTDKIAGAVFAFLYVLNLCYYTSGTMTALWASVGELLKYLGIFVLAYIILQLLFGLIHVIFKWISEAKLEGISKWSDRTFFFVAWGAIFLPCLIFAIIRYPAGIESDAAYQMLQIMGLQPITAHWPPFSSLAIATPVIITFNITGDMELAVFAQALVQSIICSCVFAYAVTFLKKLKISVAFAVAATLIIMIVPTFPGFMTALVKDTYYSIAIVWFLTLLAEMLFVNEKHYILTGISALLVTLLRNNGVYLVAAAAIALLIVKGIEKKDKTVVCIVLGAVCVLWLIYSNVILAALGIPKGSIAEALSIPFQQTARLYRDFPEDITPEENEVINRVLDTGSIGANYKPLLSDPVKGTYKGDNSALGPYFGVWLKQFFKHPLSYLDATLENSYGFWGPNGDIEYENYTYGLYYGNQFFTELMGQAENWRFPETLGTLISYAMSWNHLFFLKSFVNIGLQVWIMLYVFINCIVRKHWKLFIIAIPVFISFLVCVASPTWWQNGFRYALPIIFFNPILLALNWFNDHGPMREVKLSRQQRRQAKK